jgi:hypothetical protein
MLRKHLLHRSGGALLHVGEHVRVGVERDGYGGVPHKFVNSGTGGLRQISIHASERMIAPALPWRFSFRVGLALPKEEADEERVE